MKRGKLAVAPAGQLLQIAITLIDPKSRHEGSRPRSMSVIASLRQLTPPRREMTLPRSYAALLQLHILGFGLASGWGNSTRAYGNSTSSE